MPDRHFSESDLVRRAQDGDVAAFGQLFLTYHSRIYALCLRMVSDPGPAEDLTQETFLRAWQKLSAFGGRSEFFTWLYRLAVNVVLTDLRSRGRWNDPLIDGEDPLARQPALAARNSSKAIDLERAIAELPPRARMVFVLYDVEGYRHREITSMTGIAEGTSKAHLHRARTLLRKALRG